MNDTDKVEAMNKMDAKDFAEALWNNAVHSDGEWPGIIASRDAYREREVLKAAADRHAKAAREHARNENPHHWIEWERAAILGIPAFELGQLVRRKGVPTYYRWPGDNSGVHDSPDHYEPVIDRNGDPVYLPVEDET